MFLTRETSLDRSRTLFTKYIQQKIQLGTRDQAHIVNDYRLVSEYVGIVSGHGATRLFWYPDNLRSLPEIGRRVSLLGQTRRTKRRIFCSGISWTPPQSSWL